MGSGSSAKVFVKADAGAAHVGSADTKFDCAELGGVPGSQAFWASGVILAGTSSGIDRPTGHDAVAGMGTKVRSKLLDPRWQYGAVVVCN